MADDELASLLSARSIQASPDTITNLVKRLRAMTFKLLPLQVELSKLTDPTSRIITPKVKDAYIRAAGDFVEALPYCLLHARATFVWDANHNAADYDEHMGRAIACEVLARRVIHRVDPERLNTIMSTRFRYREWDGDDSAVSSALETAIDQHCTIFLSSSEAQHVVSSLWRGDWVQINNENNDIDYVPFNEQGHKSFWSHLNPQRLSVPRYQNVFRITIWFFFLFVYSQAVRQPLEKVGSHHPFDEWEGVLYTMAFAFSIEEFLRLYKNLRYFTFRGAFNFWTVVSLTTSVLLIAAFVLRMLGLWVSNKAASDNLHFRSFQVLSCVSPLIWMRLLTVFDGFKYVGTMQICLSRMMQESTIFFMLLLVLAAGFAQALYALDAADGETGHASIVANTLIQALLGSPDFESNSSSPFGLTLYYLWSVATLIILLNILVSLFASAYQDVVDDAEAHFLAFFAGKTVGMIRAPDSFVYPAPFNLIEIFLVAPFEFCLSQAHYAQYNRMVMSVIFFIPLTAIALFEAYLDTTKNKFMRSWFTSAIDGEEDDSNNQNPSCEEDGLEISKVPFKELVAVFPNPYHSSEASVVHELHRLQAKVEELTKMIQSEKQQTTVGERT